MAQTQTQNSSAEKITAPTQTKSRISKWKIVLALAIILLAYIAYDLFAPRHSKLRQFNADEVARLETAMWRSYYAKERVKLFTQMSELLRTQYNLPLARSNTVAYQAAKAAFVFKDGRNRADYEKALPNLINYYTSIHQVSDIDFDIEKAAKLELEWWIIHRERKQHKPGDLELALAELPAEIYRIPTDQLLEHARLRAEAMTIRDDRAEAGGVSEEDWQRIGELLKASWKSLHTAVQPAP
ncbi:MAG: hypothetical protein AB1757_15490 [Acidobacteriota bacterium]